MKSLIKYGMVMCLLFMILSGCIQQNAANKDVSGTLKVMYFNEDYFFQEYGMLFSAIYPQIDIEVISTSALEEAAIGNSGDAYSEALIAFIEKEKPDVIFTDPSQISSLLDKGILYNLDRYVSKASYNVSSLNPGVYDYMKELGGGQVHAIPSSYRTQVLFYNKQLFEQYQVPLPTDQMTWSDVLALANQFPTSGGPSERIWGLNLGWGSELTDITQVLSLADGLNYFNDETLEMTMNTPAWISLIELALEVKQSNAIFYNKYSDESYYKSESRYDLNDAFLEGRLAMKLSDDNYMDQIEEAQANSNIPEDIVQSWDIVTAPVGLQQPDSTGYAMFYNVFSIYAESMNKEAAWEFISYITGDEYAQITSKVKSGKGSLRQLSNEETNKEINYDALYKLKPIDNMQNYLNVPQRFIYEFDGLMRKQFQQLTEGLVTIEQALAHLELEGQELLDTEMMTLEQLEQYWKEQKDNITPGIIFLD